MKPKINTNLVKKMHKYYSLKKIYVNAKMHNDEETINLIEEYFKSNPFKNSD